MNLLQILEWADPRTAGQTVESGFLTTVQYDLLWKNQALFGSEIE